MHNTRSANIYGTWNFISMQFTCLFMIHRYIFLRYVIRFKWLFNELLNVHGNNLYRNFYLFRGKAMLLAVFFRHIPFILFDLVCHCVYQLMSFFAIWQTKRNEEKIKSKRSTWTEREGGVKWRRKTNICSSSCI